MQVCQNTALITGKTIRPNESLLTKGGLGAMVVLTATTLKNTCILRGFIEKK
jgi:hypothetical protein